MTTKVNALTNRIKLLEAEIAALRTRIDNSDFIISKANVSPFNKEMTRIRDLLSPDLGIHSSFLAIRVDGPMVRKGFYLGVDGDTQWKIVTEPNSSVRLLIPETTNLPE